MPAPQTHDERRPETTPLPGGGRDLARQVIDALMAGSTIEQCAYDIPGFDGSMLAVYECIDQHLTREELRAVIARQEEARAVRLERLKDVSLNELWLMTCGRTAAHSLSVDEARAVDVQRRAAISILRVKPFPTAADSYNDTRAPQERAPDTGAGLVSSADQAQAAEHADTSALHMPPIRGVHGTGPGGARQCERAESPASVATTSSPKSDRHALRSREAATATSTEDDITHTTPRADRLGRTDPATAHSAAAVSPKHTAGVAGLCTTTGACAGGDPARPPPTGDVIAPVDTPV